MRKTRNVLRVFWFRLQLFIIFFLIIFLAIFSYWFLFISPYFQIKTISVEGYNPSFAIWVDLYLQQNNTRLAPFWTYAFFPKYLENNKSYLNFYYSDLEKFIFKNNPKIETIKTNLDWKTGSLTLQIKQREISFLWCLEKGLIFLENETDKECYYLDKNGVIFERAPRTPGSFLNKIVILETKKRFLGSQVIAPERLAKIEQAFILSTKENSPISIDYLEIKTESFSEIKLITREGFDIFYDLKNDFAEMLNIISGMKEKELKDNFHNLEYIDCRYPPKIYYKLKQ